jgi:hypothetical protein
VGWLVPDIKKPVTLKLTADDAKREALGRVLSMTGAGVGILGGLIVLNANPAFRAALNRGGAVKMTMSVQQAQQDALGKSLALIGTAVGMGGSLLVMSANPKMKPQFTHAFNSLPSSVRENQRLLALLFLGGIGAAAAYMIRAQNRAYSGS